MSKLLLMLSKEKTNLMPLILLFIQYSFNAQHVSAINTTIFRSLRLIGCYFMGCIWFGVCWRSVSVWLWRCGVFMQSEAHHTAIATLKRNANTHQTRYHP